MACCKESRCRKGSYTTRPQIDAGAQTRTRGFFHDRCQLLIIQAHRQLMPAARTSALAPGNAPPVYARALVPRDERAFSPCENIARSAVALRLAGIPSGTHPAARLMHPYPASSPNRNRPSERAKRASWGIIRGRRGSSRSPAPLLLRNAHDRTGPQAFRQPPQKDGLSLYFSRELSYFSVHLHNSVSAHRHICVPWPPSSRY